MTVPVVLLNLLTPLADGRKQYKKIRIGEGTCIKISKYFYILLVMSYFIFKKI